MQASTNPGELELVRGARRGDPRSVQRLGERLGLVPRVLSAMNGRLGRPLDAHELADLTQEVLTIVWSKLDEFHGDRAFDAWVCRISWLEMMNHVRGKRRRPASLEEVGEVSARAVPSEGSRELQDVLRLKLAELSADELDVLRERHFEGRSFEDVAARLHIPLGTAKTRYYRALLRLRDLMTRRDTRQERRRAAH